MGKNKSIVSPIDNNECPSKRPRGIGNFRPACGASTSKVFDTANNSMQIKNSDAIRNGSLTASGMRLDPHLVDKLPSSSSVKINLVPPKVESLRMNPVVAAGDAQVVAVGTLPPKNGSSSSEDEARNKVVVALQLFHAFCRMLWHEDQSKEKGCAKTRKRYDLLAAKMLKEKGWYSNTGKQIVGSVPGVEIGDRFQYYVEMNIIGLHRQLRNGIDYLNEGGNSLATSVVAGGGCYHDYTDEPNVLIYMGQGGNLHCRGKELEDQKLTRGNLALKNSMDAKTPVRVIRGEAKLSNSSDLGSKTFVYDGLYFVDKVWQELAPHGKLVYKFKLVRIPGQPAVS